jgi:hypothetical protein
MKLERSKDFANRIADMLLSHAAHGLATSSVEGMGEITLRDGLIVAAAAMGAKSKRSWIIDREVLPPGWSDSAVDLVAYRKGNTGSLSMVGAVELKWWRKTDKANASNRRRDLIKDFIRASALHKIAEEFAFVALLSTADSWSSTTSTNQTDKEVMKLLSGSRVQKWNLAKLKDSSSVRAALSSLDGRVSPISKNLHSELLSYRTLGDAGKTTAFVKVWSVRRPQSTSDLNSADIKAMKPKPKKKAKANKTSLLTPDPPPVPADKTATTLTSSRSLAPGQA